jgi:hypothetical protein
LQDANQGLLLFWLIENPRWLPTSGHILMYDPMGNMIKKNSQELLKGLLKPYLAEPIRNKNGLWRPCLLTDWDEMSNMYRGPSIDASYQVLVHLAKRFQSRRF